MLMHFKQSHLISVSLCLKIQAAFVPALIWAVGNLHWSTDAAQINPVATSVQVLALPAAEFWFSVHKTYRRISGVYLKAVPSQCSILWIYLDFTVNCTLLRFVCTMRNWKYSWLTISRSSLLHFCRESNAICDVARAEDKIQLAL